MAPTDLESHSAHHMHPAASSQPPCEACANQQLPSAPVPAPSADAQQTGGSSLIVGAEPGQSAFNPFASVGVVMHQSAPIAQQAATGDWVLPVLVMCAGLLAIARLMRKLVG